MSISAGLSATRTGFELIRGLREALGKPGVDPGDIQARLVELQSLMLDAQRALGDAEEENRELKRSIQEMQEASRLDKSVIFHDQVCWRNLSDGTKEGPYCPVCWGDSQKLVRPSVWDSSQPGKLMLICTNHTNPVHFTVPRNLAEGY
jgi:hypothetical protein